ncbi:MAG: (2Fe-2S)-binding protein [Novosphingobium sp.]
MYVCICNAIRETELRSTARAVTGSAEQVYAALGRKPKCRTCLTTAAAIIGDERSRGLCAA